MGWVAGWSPRAVDLESFQGDCNRRDLAAAPRAGGLAPESADGHVAPRSGCRRDRV